MDGVRDVSAFRDVMGVGMEGGGIQQLSGFAIVGAAPAGMGMRSGDAPRKPRQSPLRTYG